MASYTSRIFLTLAISSVFGIFTLFFFKRKKLTPVEDIVVEKLVQSSSFPYQPINPLECQGNISKMQLKEKESPQISANSNGISDADQLNTQSNGAHLESEISGLTNGVSHQKRIHCQLRDVQTSSVSGSEISNGIEQNVQIQKNGNGTAKFEDQILNSDSVYINGVKRKTKTFVSYSDIVSNGRSQSNNQRLQNGNVVQPSTSNGTTTTHAPASNGVSCTSASNGTSRFSNSNGTTQASASNGTSRASAPNDKILASASNGTIRPSTSNGTSHASTSNGTIHTSISNGASHATTSNGSTHTSASNSTARASASNGTSHSARKPKKKNKDKLRENKDSCCEQPRLNDCKIDNTLLLNKDNNELSNGVASLTVNDEAPSLQDQILHCTNFKMNEDSFVNIEHTTVASSTESDNIDNSLSLPNSVTNQDTLKKDIDAKDCDSVEQLNFNNPPCASPESGRSSNSSDIVENVQTDINEPLTFSVDLMASGPLEDSMLDSPDVAYCDSLGSNDSGRGGSDILGYDPTPTNLSYEFDIPSQHCGFLIGKKGNHVNFIKEKTNAAIWIRNYPFNKEKKIVSIAGDDTEIQAALDLIRKRFPLKDYPDLSLEQSSLTSAEVLCPPSLKLALPEGVEFQVVLSATVNAGHFFIQLPTHPSYHALPPFTMSMTSLYTHCHSPIISNLYIGNIVAAPVGDGWFRGEVVEIYPEEDTCKLKYLDYGGYQIVPRTALRQINIEFMQMPFQATECYLANVAPFEEIGWTEESKIAFESLAQGQILSAYVAGVAEDGNPCLYLYQVTGATNTFINQALVEAGLLRWMTYDQ